MQFIPAWHRERTKQVSAAIPGQLYASDHQERFRRQTGKTMRAEIHNPD
jgi:hypothetical protein